MQIDELPAGEQTQNPDHLFFRTQTVDTFGVMNDSVHLL